MFLLAELWFLVPVAAYIVLHVATKEHSDPGAGRFICLAVCIFELPGVVISAFVVFRTTEFAAAVGILVAHSCCCLLFAALAAFEFAEYRGRKGGAKERFPVAGSHI